MTSKKDTKADAFKELVSESAGGGDISSKSEPKDFLLNIRDKMTEDTAAPVYAASAMNHVLSMPDIYDLLDKTNKELCRDIWLRLKKAGFHLRIPPMLFSPEEQASLVGSVGS